jgi:hypothetical protein
MGTSRSGDMQSALRCLESTADCWETVCPVAVSVSIQVARLTETQLLEMPIEVRLKHLRRLVEISRGSDWWSLISRRRQQYLPRCKCPSMQQRFDGSASYTIVSIPGPTSNMIRS